ncbi:MAG: transglutaminase-like domain-containing protein [Candidatus Woesearchaeota archaeon]
MRQINILILIILLILSLNLTSAKTVNYYEDLKLKQSVEANVKIIPTANNYLLSYFQVDLRLFPTENYHQKILLNEYFPSNIKSMSTTTSRILKWDNPPENQNLIFKDITTLQTYSSRVKINSKVEFPLKNIPLDVQKYTQFTESINTNNKIKSKAQELAQGTTDLYELEYKLGKFVHEYLKYSLSIYTENENRPSTWVYENKVGACDEYTNLFISLNRELGIPARFVSGIAYTSSELIDVNWGNHAWAEIYFPGFGWVPFDVTYKQFGFIDATHIFLNKDVDGSIPSVYYSGQGISFDFEPNQLVFKTDVLNMGKLQEDITTIELSVQENFVGFNSYNLIKAKISNPTNYYLIQSINLANTQGLEFLDSTNKIIFLKPKQQKTFYWLVKIEEGLKEGYSYTFPISLFSETDTEIKTSFEVKEDSLIYDLESMKILINEDETTKVQKFQINCNNSNDIIQNEIILLNCTLGLTKGFTKYENIEVCYKTCENYEFKSEKILFPLQLETSNLGVQTKIIKIQDKELSEEHFLTYIVNDLSKLELINISLDNEIQYKDIKNLSFEINKLSMSSVENVSITLSHKNFENNWVIDLIDENKLFDMEIKGNSLNAGINNFDLILNYKDKKGNTYLDKKSFTINLINLTLIQRVNLLFNNILNKISNVVHNFSNKIFNKELNSSQTLIFSILVLALIIFLIMVCLKIIWAIISFYYGKEYESVEKIIYSKKK